MRTLCLNTAAAATEHFGAANRDYDGFSLSHIAASETDLLDLSFVWAEHDKLCVLKNPRQGIWPWDIVYSL